MKRESEIMTPALVAGVIVFSIGLATVSVPLKISANRIRAMVDKQKESCQ
jgi:hypothetical protein